MLSGCSTTTPYSLLHTWMLAPTGGLCRCRVCGVSVLCALWRCVFALGGHDREGGGGIEGYPEGDKNDITKGPYIVAYTRATRFQHGTHERRDKIPVSPVSALRSPHSGRDCSIIGPTSPVSSEYRGERQLSVRPSSYRVSKKPCVRRSLVVGTSISRHCGRVASVLPPLGLLI